MPDTIDNIVENLFYILPIMHKKMLKVEPRDVDIDISLSRLHMGILLVLREENNLPISEIAEKLLIPKPQMTHLINHLVASGMVERQPGQHDRRVINIFLTEEGKTTLTRSESVLKGNLRKRLASLTENELEELSGILARFKDLGSRLEDKKH
jgi:DNA-binding MarR family transcriptional regulator